VKALAELRHFPKFVKLSHSVFALPFGLAALLLAARGFPGWRTLSLVVGAVITARFAAMAFNRVADVKYDALNPRTAGRHLPSGQMSLSTAWGLVAAGSLLFVGIAVSINEPAAWLSPVALAIILGYSFTKRFTSLSHFWLGAALALAPLGAWISVRNELADPVPWLLALAVMLWVAGFDMIYALQDEAFDRTHGLHSMVVSLGPSKTLILVLVLHLAMLGMLLGIGILLRAGTPYFLGLLVVAASLAWEQWLIRQPDPAKLQLAFLQANALASFGYLAAVTAEIFLR